MTVLDQAAARNTVPPTEDTEFVQFWNEVLAPKFIRFRHILVDGLTRHSEAVFPKLPVRPGDRALDVGCGFGDTAMKLARIVGPEGEVVGIDCCDAFLTAAEADREHPLELGTFIVFTAPEKNRDRKVPSARRAPWCTRQYSSSPARIVRNHFISAGRVIPLAAACP